MRPFDFYAPKTVVEALELLDRYKDSVAMIAGGTDLTLELNEWKYQPAVVIDLKKLTELDYIKVEDGIVRIGAMATHAKIAANEIIREKVHVLYDACRQVGSPQIRNLATIGGNICQSSVAGDGLAACVCLDADVTIKSVRGERTIKLDEFLAGEGKERRNILQACLYGMKLAVAQVVAALGDANADNVHVIVDGNRQVPDLGFAQTAYIKGDARAWSIAAASILAKVHRDALMVAYDAQYPGYGFAKNVGYPTAAHREALLRLGPTPIHRKSFKVK